ncbi:hypothetical protein ABNF65_08090 [Paenibacillus larvae]
MNINPGDMVRLLSGGGTGLLVGFENDRIYKVVGLWKRRGITYVTIKSDDNPFAGNASPEQLELLSKSNKKGA